MWGQARKQRGEDKSVSFPFFPLCPQPKFLLRSSSWTSSQTHPGVFLSLLGDSESSQVGHEGQPSQLDNGSQGSQEKQNSSSDRDIKILSGTDCCGSEGLTLWLRAGGGPKKAGAEFWVLRPESQGSQRFKHCRQGISQHNSEDETKVNFLHCPLLHFALSSKDWAEISRFGKTVFFTKSTGSYADLILNSHYRCAQRQCLVHVKQWANPTNHSSWHIKWIITVVDLKFCLILLSFKLYSLLATGSWCIFQNSLDFTV